MSAVFVLFLLIGCFGDGCSHDKTTWVGSTAASEDNSAALGLLREIVRLQHDQGLAVLTVFNGQMYSVDFESRSLVRNYQFKGTSQYGVVSVDGSKIALIDEATSDRRILFNLRISKLDGSESQSYQELASPSGMCWSPNNGKLALVASSRQSSGTLQIMELESRKIEIVDDTNSFTTSQCWSPDGTVLVYAKNGENGKQTVIAYNTQTKQKKELATGNRAAWIPTTDWISFLDCGVELHDCTYYAIHADGTGKRSLFKTFAAVTGLSISPDSRFGLYVSAGRKSEPKEVSWRVRVRRLQDNVEVWATDLTDTDPIEFQWIAKMKFAQPDK
jgi:hypothetical protein